MSGKARYLLGLDESGTGALSSIFTVTAFLVEAANLEILEASGVRDSKVLTDKRRRVLCEDTAHLALAIETIKVGPRYVDQRESWREAFAKAAKRCFDVVGHENVKHTRVTIDGSEDRILADYFKRAWFLEARFIPKADANFAEVSAASIWAKTVRNDAVLLDHLAYPHYGWDHNYGYGTEDHLEAIAIHGICEHHRRVKNLQHYFSEDTCRSMSSGPAASTSLFTAFTRKAPLRLAPTLRRS